MPLSHILLVMDGALPDDLRATLDEVCGRTAWDRLPAAEQAAFIRWLDSARSEVRPARAYDAAHRVKEGRSYPAMRTRWLVLDRAWESIKANVSDLLNT